MYIVKNNATEKKFFVEQEGAAKNYFDSNEENEDVDCDVYKVEENKNGSLKLTKCKKGDF